MAKFYLLKNTGADETLYIFHCPGCNYGHWIRTSGKEPRWEFNNDLEKPTVSPSILVFKDDPSLRCHSFVKNGQIEFLSDCYHGLKSTTVELPEWQD